MKTCLAMRVSLDIALSSFVGPRNSYQSSISVLGGRIVSLTVSSVFCDCGKVSRYNLINPRNKKIIILI